MRRDSHLLKLSYVHIVLGAVCVIAFKFGALNMWAVKKGVNSITYG